jgi:predicted dehydrogenase
VGEQHVAGFRRSPPCEVAVVCDFDEGKLAAAREADPGVQTTTDADSVLADPEIDIVSIASYDQLHFEQALAALRHGKHVFAEKPLCRTLDEVAALRDALAEQPQLQLTSNLVLRAAPLYRYAREQVLGGGFGAVYAFDGDYLYGRLHKITEGWRRDVEDYSVMLGGGVHLVDLMLWTTGQRPSSVTAAGNRISTEGTSFRYLDFVAATYEFPSGLVGRITANFGSVHPHQHVVRIFGTEAALVYDDLGPRIHRSRDPEAGAERLDLTPLPASKAELIPEFIRRIVEGGGGEAAQHEFDVVTACVAADRALEEGKAVDIEYA